MLVSYGCGEQQKDLCHTCYDDKNVKNTHDTIILESPKAVEGCRILNTLINTTTTVVLSVVVLLLYCTWWA